MDDEADIIKLNALLESKGFYKNQAIKLENFSDSDISDDETSLTVEDHELEDLETKLGLNIQLNTTQHHEPTDALRKEERAVIDSCTDPELKELLILNRQKNVQLIHYYKKIKDLLIECKTNIKDKTKQIETLSKVKKSNGLNRTWRIAAPYFKDKNDYYCWANDDIIRKIDNKELLIYELYVSVTNRWSQSECDRLSKAVILNYNLNKKFAMEKNKQQTKLRDKKSIIEAQNSQMKEEIVENHDSLDAVPPLGSDEFIDWQKVSDTLMMKKHTAAECRNYWHIMIHPDINKTPWTADEDAKIIKLARKYKKQNWDKIASELNTGRSGYSVCLHFMSDLNQEWIKKDKFSAEEDEKLLKLVERHRSLSSVVAWNEVAHYFPDRTRSQLFHRYTYFLNQEVRKEKFSQEEDVLLLILVDKFGKSFSKCAQYFPGRSGSQLKGRYNTNLQAPVKKGSFEIHEDEMIWEYVKKYGTKRWAGLVPKIGRCRGQLRQRYIILNRFFHANPNAGFKDVVRKKHTVWKKLEGEFHSMRQVADKFLGREIPSLLEISEEIDKLQVVKVDDRRRLDEINDSHNDIDAQLTDFFCNFYKTKTSVKYVSGRGMSELVGHVTDILSDLKIRLNIPTKLKDFKVLDAIDIKVLESLRNAQQDSNQIISKLQPPTLNTSVSFRSLLLKFENFRLNAPPQESKNFDVHIKKYLDSLPGHCRCAVINEMALFYKRFYSIFKLPAILTIEMPMEKLLKSGTCDAKPDMTPKKRSHSFLTYGKKEPLALQNNNPGPSNSPPSTARPTFVEGDDDEEDLKKLEAFLRKAKRIKIEDSDDD